MRLMLYLKKMKLILQAICLEILRFQNLKEKNFKIVDGKFGEDAVNYLNELKESDAGAFKETRPQNTGSIAEPR